MSVEEKEYLKVPRVGIVSVIYEEPEWQETKQAIEDCGILTAYVDRKGVGSLARAHNEGFKRITSETDLDYVWFITNVTFDPVILPKLVKSMVDTGYDAIHPAFDSDHVNCRPDGSGKIKAVPFIEFTAPMVRVDTFKKIKLDEKMPYWGHDVDWGYRVRKSGGTVAVDHSITVQHEYIRFKVNTKPNKVTQLRHQYRKNTNGQTKQRLVSLYGKNWRQLLEFKI